MNRLILVSIICFLSFLAHSQTLQTVTTTGNSTSNALRLSGEGNIGSSGGGELVLGLLSTAKTSDTRDFIGWKNNMNTITNGSAGTLLLQARSDIDYIPIDFVTGHGTPSLRMRIASNGNVSIGSNNTIAPSSKLLLSGDGTSNLTSSLLVQNSSNTSILKAFDNGSVVVGPVLNSNPTEKLTIQNGNIVLQSNTGVNSTMGTLKFSYPGYPDYYSGISGITESGGIDQLDLAFYTAYGSASEKMRIMSRTGYVGIGTSSPQAKLDVNGQVFIGTSDANTPAEIAPYSLAVNGAAIFTKAVVKLKSNWPDYVFKAGYQLPKLDTLEHFLKVNQHLPGIPKSEDVARNGINLGRNQAELLKKIEELTLIVIEQNKKAVAQQKLLELQNKRITKLESRLKTKN